MPRLILKTGLFAVLAALLLPYLLARTGYLQSRYLAGREIYRALELGRTRLPAGSTVVLGDSVAYQLYGQGAYSDRIYSLASSQGASLAGQYVILRNLLQHNEGRVSRVVLLLHPVSLGNDLNQRFVFNYFIKPFHREEFYPYLSESVRRRVARIPWYFLAPLPLVQISNFSPDLADLEEPVQGLMKRRAITLSDVSAEYLARMQRELGQSHVELRLLSPPLHELFKGYDCRQFRERVSQAGLAELFGAYLSFRFLEKGAFRDPIHYQNPKGRGRNPLRL